MKRIAKNIALLIFAMGAAIVAASAQGSVVTLDGGALSEAISQVGSKPSSITSLTIQGDHPLTVADFDYMRESLKSLNALDISATATDSIPTKAFYGHKRLVSVKLGESTTRICPYAFSITPLTSITAPAVKVVENDAFRRTSLSSVELPAIETLGIGVFRLCPNMKELTLGANIKNAGAAMFQNAELKSTLTVKCEAMRSPMLKNWAVGVDVDLIVKAPVGATDYEGRWTAGKCSAKSVTIERY